MTPQLELIADGGGPARASEAITIEGDRVRAVSPEGVERSIEIEALVERLTPARFDTRDAVLPDGVKGVLPIPRGTLVVHQTPPRVHAFRWIAADSSAPFGENARYREVRLALPYLIVLAVFDEALREIPKLSGCSECFFADRPLDVDGLRTKLCYPSLLNCSRFPVEDASKPLSWICVQHLSPASHAGARTAGAALRRGLTALLRHLLESGFNLSSEHHEVSSWFTETVRARVDPRVGSVEAWERASAEDPLFALEVPWLPTGRTLGEIVERIAAGRARRPARVRTARDLVRVVFRATQGKGGAR
jgi:hypothetical protein